MDDDERLTPIPTRPRTSGPEVWRLAALFRPDSIYVHLYSNRLERARLSVAGLGPEDRKALAALDRGDVVPESLVAALIRVNRLC